MLQIGAFFTHLPVGGEEYQKFFFDPHKDWLYQYLLAFFTMLNHVLNNTRFLLLLQGFAPQSHWVLKTPCHALWLDSLTNVFPNHRMIFTHRDPAETIASYCALQESYVGHMWYPGKLNRAHIGQLVISFLQSLSNLDLL